MAASAYLKIKIKLKCQKQTLKELKDKIKKTQINNVKYNIKITVLLGLEVMRYN